MNEKIKNFFKKIFNKDKKKPAGENTAEAAPAAQTEANNAPAAAAQ